MKDHRLRVSLSDLPRRARSLTHAQMKDVFGGAINPWCKHAGSNCNVEMDECCSDEGLSCVSRTASKNGVCQRL